MNLLFAWGLRLLGWLLMYLGFVLLFRPLVVRAGCPAFPRQSGRHGNGSVGVSAGDAVVPAGGGAAVDILPAGARHPPAGRCGGDPGDSRPQIQKAKDGWVDAASPR
jgi:hypothetical protein